MNFFKSAFSESDDPTPPDSPKSSPNNPNPEPDTPTLNLTWSFGSLIKTIATKSESMIETYKKDIEELGSGLKKETAVIRHVASRAVHDLPASFETGAAVAQESLESVGQAIDDIGSTVWKSTAQIISHGRDSVFSAVDHDHDSDASSLLKRQSLDVKYSRFDAQARALQSDLDTYCCEPGDKEDYEKWRSEGFVIEEKNEEIKRLIGENEVVNEIYNEVVPSRVDDRSFWSRYFYRMFKLKQAEEARALLVKRAISGDEEEDLSWDFDDDDEDEEEGNVFLSKGKSSAIVGVNNENNDEDLIEKEKDEGAQRGMDKLEEEGYNGGSSKDSDVSIVSSQSLPEEEDLGWDEIEDVGSNDENKVEAVGSTASVGTSRVEVHKRFSTAEEEEDLSWDVEEEDEDDLPVK
ncbi:unnamed protein product [Dovyalis caffra]|uniref:BSD domain-containing protein n=1 Tax=Dovyalis caffra TaxID=77055 RepID=A0AAV1RFV1_9ROSI|nr:unnamed protein product [Dovyalis caffra]